jgi:hypothetical protein
MSLEVVTTCLPSSSTLASSGILGCRPAIILAHYERATVADFDVVDGKKGRTLALPEVSIAAVALTNGLVLLTDDRKDFPMPELSFFPLPN